MVTPASKIFEAEQLMVYDVWSTIEETVANIADAIDADMDEEMLVSHLASYRIQDGSLAVQFLQGDDTHKSNASKQRITVVFESMTFLNETSIHAAIQNKKDVCMTLKGLLEEKFADFKEPVFCSMKWFDCKKWPSDKLYGFDQLKSLCKYFEMPLNFVGFEEVLAMREWRSFKNYVNANHFGEETCNIWRAILQNKRQEYPNLSILAELILCLSGSNSTVERAFSLLTLLLSDKRLSMAHVTMQDLMVISINNKIWSEGEREAITQAAVDRYMEKRRLKRWH